MKKFEKRFLKEVLGFNNEEVKLTMEAQRRFLSILVNDGEGFCLDGRLLYTELGVSRKFTDWIKTNLENVDAEENKDYIFSWVNDKGVHVQGNVENTKVTELTGQGYKKEYKLTLDIAKEICMITGLSSKTGDILRKNSKLIRKYFILIERGLKGIKDHIAIREPEKENYNIMKETIISNYESKHSDVTELDKKYLMIRESNMINTKLVGYTASEIRDKLGYLDRQTREHLEIKINKAINYLQEIITGLVIAGIDFEERSRIVENICNNKYSDLKMN